MAHESANPGQVQEAPDQIGRGWRMPTFSQRGNMTEVVTGFALDITGICQPSQPQVSRVLILVARTDGWDCGLVRVALWLGSERQQVVHTYAPHRAGQLQSAAANLATALGLSSDQLLEHIRQAAHRAGVRVG